MTTLTAPSHKLDHPAPLRIQTLINEDLLSTLSQPVTQLNSDLIYGYEALVRSPVGIALEYPDALFAAGRREGLTVEPKMRCPLQAPKDWSGQKLAGKPLIHMSAASLASAVAQDQGQGGLRFHPCTALSIGVARINPGSLQRAEEVASAAPTAKRHAKHEQLSIL